MSTLSIPGAVSKAPSFARWRKYITQESIATAIVSIVVAGAVLLPLFTLVISAASRCSTRTGSAPPGG